MKERQQLTKKSVDQFNKEHYFKYDEENRLIISMELKNDDIFFDELSQKDCPVISTQIADYIDKVTIAITPSEKFTLRIYSDSIDENEREIYTKAIKNYYMDKYIVDNRRLNIYRKMSFVFGMIGILVLTLVIILEYMENSVVWMRVFDIVAWVFIWESVDIIAFKCKELRFNQLRYLNFIDMKIEFK